MALFTVPGADTVIEEVATVANPWLEQFLPIIYISLGVFAFALLFLWLPRVLIGAFNKLFGRNTQSFQYGREDENFLAAVRHYDKTGQWPKIH